MNLKELTLASFAAALVLSPGCVVEDDDPAGDTETDTNATTMTATNPTSGPTTDPSTSGPTTTDPTTATDTADTDPTGDTDTDTDTETEGGDPDVYDFREDESTAYTQVERMGFPGVNTALIESTNQDAYNAAAPTNDAAGDFLADVAGALTVLHTGGDDGDGLDDDLEGAIEVLFADVLAGDPTLEASDFICNAPGSLDPNDTCVAQGGPFVFPDVIQINTMNPSGFPNGRNLDTPVIDVVLAVLLLDVLDPGKAPVPLLLNAFTDLDPETDGLQGLSQSGNDVAFPGSFPYLAPAHE